MLTASGLSLDLELNTHAIDGKAGGSANDGSGRYGILIFRSGLVLSLLGVGYAGT